MEAIVFGGAFLVGGLIALFLVLRVSRKARRARSENNSAIRNGGPSKQRERADTGSEEEERDRKKPEM